MFLPGEKQKPMQIPRFLRVRWPKDSFIVFLNEPFWLKPISLSRWLVESANVVRRMAMPPKTPLSMRWVKVKMRPCPRKERARVNVKHVPVWHPCMEG